jgi:hypothetical protein
VSGLLLIGPFSLMAFVQFFLASYGHGCWGSPGHIFGGWGYLLISTFTWGLPCSDCMAGNYATKPAQDIDIDIMRSVGYNTKGKPSGLGSASASAFFHPWYRCKSKNVAQWSLLTVNSDKNLSRNWRPPCITST